MTQTNRLRVAVLSNGGSSAQESKKVNSELWAVLAAIRFGLAVWVLFAHSYNFGATKLLPPVPSLNALVAVYGFLAISGFSIRHSIAYKPAGFLYRRFWRIVPVHIASVFLALFVYVLCQGNLVDGFKNQVSMPDKLHWFGCLFLLQAVYPVAIDILFPAWSLSIEVIFYLIAPVMRRISAIAIVLLIGSVSFYFYRPLISPDYIGLDTYGISALALFWAWLSGWIAYEFRGNKWMLLFLGGVGCLCIAGDPLLSGCANYAIWFAIIFVQMSWPNLKIQPSVERVLNYLGEISYPIYLIHYPILFLLCNYKHVPSLAKNAAVVQILIVVIVSIGVFHIVDNPLRRRFSGSRFYKQIFAFKK